MPNSADNKDIIKCNANGEDVSERALGVKLFETGMKPANHKINNNIRHVVPVGLIIVLFTLYLLSRGQEDNRHDDAKRQELAALEAAKRIKILEKYKDLCTELEVFTKDDPLKEFDIERGQPPEASVGMISGGEKTDVLEKTESNTEHVVVKNNNAEKENYKNNNSNINIKPNSNNKKGQPMPKKTNTAEPIIYLFALVFIYLLLKAASDINQHYKSKNKGDKRLRRCSLQSYAQTHKQERRASKAKKSAILANLRKYTSFDEQNRLANIQCGVFVLPKQTTWETQCESIPISSNNQRQKLYALPIPVSNMARRTSLAGVHVGTDTHMGGLKVADHGQDAQVHEVKRRVRMINRH